MTFGVILWPFDNDKMTLKHHVIALILFFFKNLI